MWYTDIYEGRIYITMIIFLICGQLNWYWFMVHHDVEASIVVGSGSWGLISWISSTNQRVWTGNGVGIFSLKACPSNDLPVVVVASSFDEPVALFGDQELICLWQWRTYLIQTTTRVKRQPFSMQSLIDLFNILALSMGSQPLQNSLSPISDPRQKLCHWFQ